MLDKTWDQYWKSKEKCIIIKKNGKRHMKL